jgi:hypothetical protein
MKPWDSPENEEVVPGPTVAVGTIISVVIVEAAVILLCGPSIWGWLRHLLSLFFHPSLH